MTGRTAGLLIVAAAVPGLPFLVLVFYFVYVDMGIEFKESEVQSPLKKMEVTQLYDETTEIFATLKDGVPLEQAVNLELFEGFDPQMTAGQAQKKLGSPTGNWDDPFCRKQTPYYQRPSGKVSIYRYGGEYGSDLWDIVAFPNQCTHDHAFLDSAIPQQIVGWLPTDQAVSVHILRQRGWGGVTVKMTRDGCRWIVLRQRESASTVERVPDTASERLQ